MIEPRSTATIRALASLAELSADQLEEGASIDEVVATLRKAAEAVRLVIDTDDLDDDDFEESDLAQDLTPMDLSADGDERDDSEDGETEDENILNAS